jgi:hypothetical protein
MWDLEPGPLVLSDFPVQPQVMTPGRLTRHLDTLVPTLRDTDGPLQSTQGTIAQNNSDGLEELYQTTIVAAGDEAAQHAAAGDDHTADRLATAGDGSENYRLSVQRYLPGPDASIPDDFVQPPPNVDDYPIDYQPPLDVPGTDTPV